MAEKTKELAGDEQKIIALYRKAKQTHRNARVIVIGHDGPEQELSPIHRVQIHSEAGPVDVFAAHTGADIQAI